VGWLKIVKEGAHQVDEGTQERLAGRCYTLVATPPDLLVGVPWSSDAAAAERVILAGDLERIAFPELISLVAHNRTSGVLRVTGSSGTRTIIFSEGEVRGAASQRVGERLAEVAMRMGLLKQEQLDQLRDDSADGRRPGRLAVERGMLSERDLWNAIQEHVIAIFQAILLEAGGTFVLTEEDLDDVQTVPGLPVEPVLMEGVRRIDELRFGGSLGAEACAPERIIASFNGALRDIFTTADQAGVGAALRAALLSSFEEDASNAPFLRGIEISKQGELPAGELLERAVEVARKENAQVDEMLSTALSNAVLFLLFVAGEHLDRNVHQALHARVKAIIARD
jgi:hypothetical protein